MIRARGDANTEMLWEMGMRARGEPLMRLRNETYITEREARDEIDAGEPAMMRLAAAQ